MELLRRFKEKKETDDKENRHILWLEGIAKNLEVPMAEAEAILDKKKEITLEQLEIWKKNTSGYTNLCKLFRIVPDSISYHPSGSIESFVREGGEAVVRKFGLESNDFLLSEGFITKYGPSKPKFLPNSSRPIKFLKNNDNSLQMGVYSRKDNARDQKYVVALWENGKEGIKIIESFPYIGAASDLEGKAALAKALQSVETRFKLKTQ